MSSDPLSFAQPAVRTWFDRSFARPTDAQRLGWGPIVSGESTLLLAPTGSGKTLAAFLVAIDRLMFAPVPDKNKRCRVLYISPLKALGVDVERNLRAPIHGIVGIADREGATHRVPQVAVRSGDTPASERARHLREPPDILITTPESLYLLLTSNGREFLRSVDTVIVDEIHSMVATKRGAHLFVSLERLEDERRQIGIETPMQRIGLSATQRPLDEIARLLGGASVKTGDDAEINPRHVTIVDAGRKRPFDVTVEVPVEDMARMGQPDVEPEDDDGLPVGTASGSGELPNRSIWPSIHPRLVELIRAHRSTMVFCNSRRLAERLADAINATAGEELARAHHGSIAREARLSMEDRLKRGDLPAIVATSSLELGIDMGAVDLVIQIEAPPSVASGLQRIGRAGHHVGGLAQGIVFPKFRGDLLACAAVTRSMAEGHVEATYYPRNPLDVLAQQVVAMVSVQPRDVDELYALVRQAAPFAELPRGSFEGVLDLLAGRYPSDEFAGLRPRITWDRLGGSIEARRGAKLTAIANAGTIPDRGLYGVFTTANADSGKSSRVGELDEEMVFETRPGDVFILGATSWRVAEITHDRVVVQPAPGEPGRMPFWRGDRVGRPVDFGRAIGELSRALVAMPTPEAESILQSDHGLDPLASRNLMAYLHDQREATVEVPSDQTIVVERFIDEVGDWRVLILSPFGTRVHAPWATAVAGRLRQATGLEVDTMWSDDGIVFRLPESDHPPDAATLFPGPDEIEDLVVRELGATALFAARFRENAGRSLLLPRRMPGKRTPLWVQRRRSADLLSVASRYPDFPVVLETYRECLRDVFDLPGLASLLGDVVSRKIRVRTVDSRTPSPFAASLLFDYVASYIYEGDAPLAERRAQALALDHAQLRELLGDAELRELIDGEAVDALALTLQRLDGARPLKHPDDLHDLLLQLGDLSRDEVRARAPAIDGQDVPLDAWIDKLLYARRIIEVGMAGDQRLVAAEDAGRLRDALGVVPPPGLPDAFLEPPAHPLLDLVSRFARTHAPFRPEDVAVRLGIGVAPIRNALATLASQDRVLEGEFTPGTTGRQWCEAGVLRVLKRRSIAKLRAQVEPVDRTALGLFLPRWHGLGRRRRGLEGLLEVVEQLQGHPIPASVLETEVLPARVDGYSPAELDALCAAGEVVWRGVESLGSHDGRVVLYLAGAAPFLAADVPEVEGELPLSIVAALEQRGALFYPDLQEAIGGFPQTLFDALWDLVWAGAVTNDTLAPVRALIRGGQGRSSSRGRPGLRGYSRMRTRRTGPAGSEGRWSLFRRRDTSVTATERQTAMVTQLLQRHGVLTREAVAAEPVTGGFSAIYPVLKAMEEAGRIRRGYFVEGLGAAQFALPGAEDRLRNVATEADAEDVVVLAATDPANAYGAALGWPRRDDEAPGGRPGRAAGASVVLAGGRLLGYVGRTGNSVLTFIPEDEPARGHALTGLAKGLRNVAQARRGITIGSIDGAPPDASPLAEALQAQGFESSSRGLTRRRTLDEDDA